MKIITSAANPIIKDIKALALKKRRAGAGLFTTEGLQALGMAAARGWVPQQLLISEAGTKHKIGRAVMDTVPADAQLLVTPQILARLSARDNPPAAIGVYEARWVPLETLKPAKQDVWVVLEGVRDPGNLGTIIRTADAAGAAGVMLVGETCDPYSIEAVRASMGSLFAVKLVRTTTSALGEWAPQNKVRLLGTALAGAVDYRKADYTGPLGLVMGTEQSGLSAAMQKLCVQLVKLPMAGSGDDSAESLNLSVATGIMLYKILHD